MTAMVVQAGKVRRTRAAAPALDSGLLIAALALLGLGLVMVSSASIAIAEQKLGQPFYYLLRQLAFVGAGLACGLVVLRTPLHYWHRASGVLLLLGLGMLVLVLVPALNKVVNGSARWIALGPVNLQPSELMKLFVVIYLAGYLVRRADELRSSFVGFMRPMLVLVLTAVLLLMEPDFGTAVVLFATALGMMFIGGVRLSHFGGLLLLMCVAAAALMLSSPYRLERLTGFLNPWADPFDSGFQLTQALIAFGRGEWWGMGLGGSVQKLFYLPEAHTDFVFAVLAEELGLVGALCVVGLYGLLVWRAFLIAWRSERAGHLFGAYLAYGLGIWLGLQAFINLGVNMGLLPTKGLTLPLMSYGGSSMLVTCVAVALLLRVGLETNAAGTRR